MYGGYVQLDFARQNYRLWQEMQKSKKISESAMREKLAFLIFALLIFLSGCSTKVYLYPVAGPLSKIQPTPVLIATADSIKGNAGNMSLTLPDGEQFKGKWSSIAPMSVGYTGVSASGSATSGMTYAWSTVYDSEFSVSNPPGVNKGEAMIVGNRGTVMQVEFYIGSGTANGTGVAKDNKGNIYKVLF